ncbi:PucR family transcriptional regulator [Deinococcus sp.]|uniref:PucR family transcriptional regulator n=1 Tax=Deinococcus sp. TaxID=47478 RepID=UPI003C7DFE4C
MRLSDLLALPICQDARIVAGSGHLHRPVLLAHVIDVPHAERWVGSGTLMLTTGLSWPRDRGSLVTLGEQLAAREPAAVLLAVPGPFPGFPPEVAQALSACGIPALELPYEVPFAEVVAAVHRVSVGEQTALIARSESIHRALTGAALKGGLYDVVQTLALHLGGAVLMCDQLGEVLLSSGTPEVRLPAASALRAALARPGTVPRPLGDGLLTPVVVRGERAGGLWIESGAESRLVGQRQAGRQQAGDTLGLLERSAEQAATVAALLLLAQRDLEQREAQIGAAVVDRLLEGRLGDDPVVLERACRLGFDPALPCSVALLGLPESVPPLSLDDVARRERLSRQVRDALRAMGAPALMSVGQEHLWLLLPGHVSPQRLWERVRQTDSPPTRMVYTPARAGAEGIAQARAEALRLLPHVPYGQVQGAQSLLLPRALGGDPQAQRELVAAFLGPLRAVRGGEALIGSVRALCQNDWAQERAAVALGIHKNTLRYRMERVEELSGRPLAHAETRALWWLALQFDQLTSAAPST